MNHDQHVTDWEDFIQAASCSEEYRANRLAECACEDYGDLDHGFSFFEGE